MSVSGQGCPPDVLRCAEQNIGVCQRLDPRLARYCAARPMAAAQRTRHEREPAHERTRDFQLNERSVQTCQSYLSSYSRRKVCCSPPFHCCHCYHCCHWPILTGRRHQLQQSGLNITSGVRNEGNNYI